MFCPRGAAIRIGAAFIARPATVFRPLAAVLIPEHVWGGLDAHAGLTASEAPHCFYGREFEGKVVKARGREANVTRGRYCGLSLSAVGT